MPILTNETTASNYPHAQSSPSYLTPLDQLAQVLVPQSSPVEVPSPTRTWTYRPRHDDLAVSFPSVSVTRVPEAVEDIQLTFEPSTGDDEEATTPKVWMSLGTLELPEIVVEGMGPLLAIDDAEKSRDRWEDDPEGNWRAYDCDGYYHDNAGSRPRLLS